LKSIEINHHLITTLVERWITETYTFHLPLRDMTITLEVVVVQLVIPIDEKFVTGVSSGDLVFIVRNCWDLWHHKLWFKEKQSRYLG